MYPTFLSQPCSRLRTHIFDLVRNSLGSPLRALARLRVESNRRMKPETFRSKQRCQLFWLADLWYIRLGPFAVTLDASPMGFPLAGTGSPNPRCNRGSPASADPDDDDNICKW